MQNYKVVVNKGSKRHTFVISAIDKKQAEERIHKEGYSILNIENITDEKGGASMMGNMFIFEIEKNGEIKKGKAGGNDIFKVYINLRKNLGYNILKLYSQKEENLSDDYYKKIIEELEEEYIIFNSTKEEQEKINNNIDKKEEKKEFEDFYLKKNLEEIYKLIGFILEKLKNIIDGKEIKNLDDLEKIKLKNILNSIIKIKPSTNIFKLKEIGELALLKIGQLEKNSLEEEENAEIKKLLKETNILLKKIGSKNQIIEDKYDYIVIIKNKIKNSYINIKKLFGHKKNKEKKVDLESYYYIKNELLIKKYEEKLQLNTKNIIKNIFLFKNNEKNFLRRLVIKQNIMLLKAKKKKAFYSYTKIKNGYKNLIKNIINIIKFIRKNLLYVINTYTITFLIFINISSYTNLFDNFTNIDYINYNGIFYFIIILFLYIILFLSRNLISIILNFILIFYIFLIGIINF